MVSEQHSEEHHHSKGMFYLSKTHRLGLMIAMTITYFGVELVVGHFCDSVTLVADSFHMLSDVLALVIALGAVRMSKKPRDGRHTYGFQRSEILGTLVNTVMLVTLCFTIIVEAIQKIIEPHPMKDPKLIVYVGAGGLLINLIGICLFCGHGGGHGHSHLENRPSPEAEALMQHQSLLVLEETRQGNAPEDTANIQQAVEINVQDNGSPTLSAAAAAAVAGGSTGEHHGHGGSSAVQIEQVTAAALTPTSAAAAAAPASGPTTPSIIVAVEHSVASLRRASLGPSWLPNALPRHADENIDDDNNAADVVDGGGGGHGGAARGAGHMNMQAAFLHIMGDTLGSVIVIISALTLWLAPPGYSLDLYEHKAVLKDNETCYIEEPSRRWQTYIDPCLSLLLVSVMMFTTIPLLRKALNILMQTVPKEIKLDILQSALQKLDGVEEVHDLHVWQLQTDCYIGTVHIRCRNLREYIIVSRKAKNIFHNFNIHCTTIQPEFNEHTSPSLVPIDGSPNCFIDCGNDKCSARSNCCAVRTAGHGAATSGGAEGTDAPNV